MMEEESGRRYRNWMLSPIMVAFLVIVGYAGVALLTGPNIMRSVIGVAAVFAMGYCAFSLIRGATLRLTIVEKIAMSSGLAIVLTTASALLSSALGMPISDISILLLAVPIGALAILNAARTRDSGVQIPATVRNILDFSEYQRGEKIVIVTLLAAISVALAALLLVALITVPDTLSSGIAITGPDGTPASLPTNVTRGTTTTFNVTILGGSSPGDFTLRMRLTLSNATGGIVYHQIAWAYPVTLNASSETSKTVTVDSGSTRIETVSFIIDDPGTYIISLDLVSSVSVIASSHFQLTVFS